MNEEKTTEEDHLSKRTVESTKSDGFFSKVGTCLVLILIALFILICANPFSVTWPPGSGY